MNRRFLSELTLLNMTCEECTFNDAIVVSITENADTVWDAFLAGATKLRDTDESIMEWPTRPPFDNMILSFNDLQMWLISVEAEEELIIYEYSFWPTLIEAYKDGSNPMSHCEFTLDLSGFSTSTKPIKLKYWSSGLYWSRTKRFDTNRDKKSTAHFVSIFGMLRQFLDMLSCKNVRFLEKKTDRKLVKKHQRKGHMPLFSYYTLEIEQHATTSRNGKQQAKHLWTNRVHLCRGHIMRYLPEMPHVSGFVGNMWCPPHMRGNKQKGRIVKDYELKWTRKRG